MAGGMKKTDGLPSAPTVLIYEQQPSLSLFVIPDTGESRYPIKEWKRSWKIKMNEKGNPEWFDLYAKLS